MSGIFNQQNIQAQFELEQEWFQQNPAATTISSEGTSTTLTATGTASVVNDTTGEYIDYLSATNPANSIMGVIGGFTDYSGNDNPVYSASMKTGTSITSIRLWCGLTNSNVFTLNVFPNAGIGAAFKYVPAVDGTAFWRTSTSTGAAITTTTTTTAIAADTRYNLRIDWRSPTFIIFSINGVPVATHTTNLPALTQSLALMCGGSMTSNGNARSIRFRRMSATRGLR